jgi:hypothetical protein
VIEEYQDVITILQVSGQFFGIEDLESRVTPFQDREDDVNIPTHHALPSSVNHSSYNIEDKIKDHSHKVMPRNYKRK